MAGLGLDLTVDTLYGPRPTKRLKGMAKVKTPVHHLGLASTQALLRSLARVKENWGPGRPHFCGRWRCGGGGPSRLAVRLGGRPWQGCTWPAFSGTRA